MVNLATTLDAAHRRNQDGDFPLAEQLYRQVLLADPYNTEAIFQLASACQAQGRWNEALAHLDRGLSIQPDHPEVHHARGLVFAAIGDLNEAVEAIRHAVRLKPDYAVAYYNLGVTLARAKRFEEAVVAFRQAIRFKPDYADAILNLAHAFEEQGKKGDAIAAYQRLLRIRPDDAAAHNALGLLLAGERRTDEAMKHFRRAITLNPSHSNYQNNLGTALSELGRPTDALKHFEAAVHLKPDHAEAHKSCGMSWLHLGDFERGWAEFEWRWKCKDFNPPSYRQPPWDGTPLEGRRILLYTEQGIGDTFQFIRYASILARRGALVLVDCPKFLVPILRSCPGVAHVFAHGSALPDFECHAPLMSLPRLVGTTLETVPTNVPYLSADSDLVERWTRELGLFRAFKVGIVWRGNPKNGNDCRRSVPLRCFAPLAAVPGVLLFSLQISHGLEQLAEVIGHFPIIDLGGRFDFGNFMTTAAAMCNLDLIVSCDTATAHLAGALGRPVWVPLSFASEWRWLLARDDSPWYPTMRLFRQSKLGEWDAVFAQMAGALGKLMAEENRPRTVGVDNGETREGFLLESCQTKRS